MNQVKGGANVIVVGANEGSGVIGQADPGGAVRPAPVHSFDNQDAM